VGSDGGVFNFGDAHFYGSGAGDHLTGPIVAMAATADAKGYWLVSSTGQVFNFATPTITRPRPPKRPSHRGHGRHAGR